MKFQETINWNPYLQRWKVTSLLFKNLEVYYPEMLLLGGMCSSWPYEGKYLSRLSVFTVTILINFVYLSYVLINIFLSENSLIELCKWCPFWISHESWKINRPLANSVLWVHLASLLVVPELNQRKDKRNLLSFILFLSFTMRWNNILR